MGGNVSMDINTLDKGEYAVIKTEKEFILKVGDIFFGPFQNTKDNVRRVYKLIERGEKIL